LLALVEGAPIIEEPPTSTEMDGEDEEQQDEGHTLPPWPVLDDKALYGLAGDLVRTIAPHAEADPAALLIQTLLEFGNVIDHKPHCMAEADYHGLNEFTVLQRLRSLSELL
jgi:hypothetical protein